MSLEERRNHLFLVTDHLLASHREWVEQDTPYVTEAFEQSVDDALEVYRDGDVPRDCRGLDSLFNELAERWAKWKAEAAASGDEPAVPDHAFWVKLDQIAKAREIARPKARRQLETVADLTAQKVPDRQICKIYGWVDDVGNPDLKTLQEERASPGTHVGPDFVPPHERRRQEEESRRQDALDRIRERTERKLRRRLDPAPEPLAELVEQGLSATQIARMKRCTIEDVYRECEALGIEPPAETYGIPTGIYDRVPNESEERIEQATLNRGARPESAEVEGAATIEEEVLAYHAMGMKPNEIARAVSTEEERIGVRKVRSILAAAGGEPVEVEAADE